MKKSVQNIYQIIGNDKSPKNITSKVYRCEILCDENRIFGGYNLYGPEFLICEMCKKFSCHTCFDEINNVCAKCIGTHIKCVEEKKCVHTFCAECHLIFCCRHKNEHDVWRFRYEKEFFSAHKCFCSKNCKEKYLEISEI